MDSNSHRKAGVFPRRRETANGAGFRGRDGLASILSQIAQGKEDPPNDYGTYDYSFRSRTTGSTATFPRNASIGRNTSDNTVQLGPNATETKSRDPVTGDMRLPKTWSERLSLFDTIGRGGSQLKTDSAGSCADLEGNNSTSRPLTTVTKPATPYNRWPARVAALAPSGLLTALTQSKSNSTPKPSVLPLVAEAPASETGDESNSSWSSDGSRLEYTPERSPLLPVSASSAPAQSIALKVSQLRDHNHRSFKIPKSLEEWKAGAQNKDKELGDTPAQSSNPPTAVPKRNPQRRSLLEDIRLLKASQDKHEAAKPRTTIVSRLPEPYQIRDATEHSRLVADRRAAKRKERESNAEGALKRQCRESEAGLEVHGEDGREDEGTPLSPLLSPRGKEPAAPSLSSAKGDTSSSTLPRSVQRFPLPIQKGHVVVQYTVFRTRRFAHLFDGNLVGKIIRGQTFVDKNKANQFALQQMPPSGPSVARVEHDYGAQDPGRDGMFFGRVTYKDGDVAFVYVDREAQQFGKMDPSEFEDKPMRPAYKQLLVPRFDVFVFLHKPLDCKDGRYIVYEYDEPENQTRGDPWAECDGDRKEDGQGSGDDAEENAEDDEVAKNEKCDGEVNDENRSNRGEETRANAKEPQRGCCHEAAKDAGRSSVSDADETGAPTSNRDLGTEITTVLEGSFTTLGEANARAVDAFERWTRPEQPARLDAVMYYHDVLRPYAAELRRQLDEESTKNGQEQAQICWKPTSQMRYAYESISVVIVKSQLEGPIDLTGAF